MIPFIILTNTCHQQSYWEKNKKVGCIDMSSLVVDTKIIINVYIPPTCSICDINGHTTNLFSTLLDLMILLHPLGLAPSLCNHLAREPLFSPVNETTNTSKKKIHTNLPCSFHYTLIHYTHNGHYLSLFWSTLVVFHYL